MNTGGRRRPLGPRVRGLSSCALLLAVLGLWLGAAAGHSVTAGHRVPAVSHVVADLQVALRPTAPDDATMPGAAAVLVAAFLAVVRRTRPTPAPVRVRIERRQGRAPPGAVRER